jgi:hypothetical protein
LLVDQDGQAQGGLGVDPEGIAQLRLFGKNGLPSAVLSVTAEGAPALSLVEAANQRVLLSFGLGLVVYDRRGLPRATLGVSPDGSGTLTLIDQQGQVVWSAP